MRHAKAAAGTLDVDRPLTDRGRGDAAAIGRWLEQHELRPDLTLVSPARRAAQTWEQLAGALTGESPSVQDRRVYVNTADALLAVLHDTPAEVHTLAVVGHNPSIAEFALALDDQLGDAAARRELAGGFATSGVAVFALPGTFTDVQSHTATLLHFTAARG